MKNQGWPDPIKVWYYTGVLTLAYTVSFIDRQILSLLVGPIKVSLNISDTQMGLLHGFAFALFYVLVGLPVAWLADFMNRKYIILTGIFFWSLMTAACGLASSFVTLFLARVGVGVGEGCLTPPAISMLGDYFPRGKLTRALGLYFVSPYLGSGFALIIGGVVIQWISAMEPFTLPIIGRSEPWQIVFFIVGLPGILVAMLILTLREPIRSGLFPDHSGPASAKPKPLSLSFVSSYFVVRWKLYGPIILGHSMLVLVLVGVGAWTPEFYIRTYGLTRPEVGLYYGLIVLICGPAGVIAGAWCVGWLQRKGYEDANLRASLFGTIGIILPAFLGPLMPTAQLAFLLSMPTIFFIGFPIAAEIAALQMVTPNQMRAQIMAVFMLAINIIGTGLGPLIIGMLTDYVFADENALRYSLAMTATIAATLSAIFIAAGLKPYRLGLEESQAWIDESKKAAHSM